jgi:capsid protein
LAHEYARQGRDWEEALRQRAKEAALMRELGLTPGAAAPAPADEQERSDERDEAATEE